MYKMFNWSTNKNSIYIKIYNKLDFCTLCVGKSEIKRNFTR